MKYAHQPYSVPATYKDFPLKKQGELDYACSLYCILSAAIRLKALPEDAGPATILAKPQIPQNLPKRLLTKGATEHEVRCLAASAGLQLQRQNDPNIDDLQNIHLDNHIWMALVWMSFVDPKGGSPAGGNRVIADIKGSEKHYVLILGSSPHYVTVADPHPRHQDVYRMAKTDFEQARMHQGYRWMARLKAR